MLPVIRTEPPELAGYCFPDYYSQFIRVRIIQDSCGAVTAMYDGENGIIRLNVLSTIILPSIRLDSTGGNIGHRGQGQVKHFLTSTELVLSQSPDYNESDASLSL